MPARSLLFVPATSDKKIAKAFSSEADELIVDLEDAVSIEEKPAARLALPGIVALPRVQPLWIRVNAASTEFCYLDLLALVKAATTIPRAPGMMLPKVESAEEVRCIDWILSQLEREAGLADRSVAVMAIVESAAGLAAVNSIAAASPRVKRLVFGAGDLGNDMNIDISDAAGATDCARFSVAMASRAAGLEAPIDTAYVDVKNLDGLAATSQRARGFGYAGKCCIHPAQLSVVNSVFKPSQVEIAFARRIVTEFAAAEREGKAALLIDGQMIDYPFVYRAQRLLDSLTPSQP